MNRLEIPRIGILASGSGSTAEAFIHATQNGQARAEVALVVSNNREAGVMGRVARLNAGYGLHIATHHISGATHPEGPAEKGALTDQESEALRNLMDKEGIALVLLLGYMKRVRGAFLEAYGYNPDHRELARMLNSHPGPLRPAEYNTEGLIGIHVQERVLEQGMPYSAVTTNMVAPDYDAGPVVAETRVPVEPGDTPDTLFARVQVAEKATLPGVVDDYLDVLVA